MQANEALRNNMKTWGITQWALAQRLGLSENTVHRRLRVELGGETAQLWARTVRQIHDEGAANKCKTE